MKNRILFAVAAALLMSLARVSAAPPGIDVHPTNWPSAFSVGANVGNRVIASPLPLNYEWRLNGVPVPGQTRSELSLTNVQVADAGGYTVVVSNTEGTAETAPVPLDVDPTYTQITRGPLVEDPTGGWNAILVDYDGDGWVDVIVVPGGDRLAAPAVFHNEGGATFRKVLTNAIAQTAVQAYIAVWGDYDNDGKPDLFLPNTGTMNDILFRNNGDGVFTRISTGHPVADGLDSIGGAWADYDRDGFLDLFVTTGVCQYQSDLLYRSIGDGTFRGMTVAEVGSIFGPDPANDAVLWADVNNDGWPELSKAGGPCGGDWTNQLYHLGRDGKFSLMDIGEMGNPFAGYTLITWADYDNDGFLDAVVAAERGRVNFFRNLAGQGFTNITATAFPSGVANCVAWGGVDYDNDGWQDVLLYTQADSQTVLFRNNADGSFTRTNVGGPTAMRWGTHWGDFNNDGFLDVLGINGYGKRNSLWLHNGNADHWLKVKLDGRASNRSGIGAKVRALSTIGGRTFWQMREISGQGIGIDNGLIAHFGLGDATNVTTLLIEWPSGIIQTLTNVAAGQMLTLSEHQEYTNAPPALSAPTALPNGVQFTITEPLAGAVYALEASTDLVNWTKLMARTSAGGTFAYTNAFSASYSRRFYRVVVP